jgi:hypothetical protein
MRRVAGSLPTSREAFARHAGAFEMACEEASDQLRCATFCCAGAALGLRVVGVELAELLARALLDAGADGSPVLSIDVWDARVCPTDPGDLPSVDELGVRLVAGREVVAPSACGRYLRYSGPGFTFRFDRQRRRVVGRCASPEALSWWNRSRPLQPLVAVWLADCDRPMVHAALVAREGRGVLLVGANGSGKSTCALAALDAGFDFLADDAASIEAGTPSGEVQAGGVVGHALYTTLKLSREALELRPGLADVVEPHGDPADDELLLFVAELEPSPLVASAGLSAIAFPRVKDTPASRYMPLARSQALVALMASLLSVARGRVGSGFELAQRVVAQLPAFELEVGRSAASLAATLGELSALEPSPHSEAARRSAR